MRVDVSFKHMETSPLLENVIDKNIKKVERRIKLFKIDDAVHVSLHLEKNPHRNDYLSWANIYMPQKVLKSESRDETPQRAINDCFHALLIQLDKVKHKLETHLRKK